MSAFVIDCQTMDRCIRGITGRTEWQQIVRSFAGIPTDSADAGTLIGRRLFSLNIEAVMQRYPDTQDSPDDLPGTEGCIRYPETYLFSEAPGAVLTRRSMIDSVKALQCLRYQCSEGDVDKSELFDALDRVIGKLAEAAVETSHEYDTAAWGG